MYSIEFSQTAEKQLYRLEKEVQKRIITVLDRIRIRPFYFVKKKQGSEHYILRVGEYRLILEVKEKESKIFIVKLGHRRNIYY